MNAERAPPMLLLGVGNVNRRDDGIGPALVTRLDRTLPPRWRSAIERGDDVARLLAAWEGAESVLAIDAAVSDAPAGTFALHAAGEGWSEARSRDPSSHGFGLREAVALSLALGTLPPTFLAASVVGIDFGHGTGLSPTLSRRLDVLAEEVAKAMAGLAPTQEEGQRCTKPH